MAMMCNRLQISFDSPRPKCWEFINNLYRPLQCQPSVVHRYLDRPLASIGNLDREFDYNRLISSVEKECSQLEIDRGSKGGQSWRESRWLVLVEFGLVACIYVGREHHILKVAAIPYLLLFAWISLRVRRLKWRQIGFARYRTWARTLLLGIAGGVGLELFDLFGKQRILTRLLGKPPDLSDFAKVRGHLGSALLMVALIWIFAAFGEEFFYRGYLMNRVADLGFRTRSAWIVSLLVTSFVFGLTHYHQGLTGIVEEGSDGLILGLIYFACGRNLAVPIVTHGVCDTIDIALLFLGKYPGL